MQNCCRLQEFIIYLLISLYLLLKERPLVWIISGQSALFLYLFALDIFVFQKLNKITKKKLTLQQINNMRNEYL